ncbi:MAG: 5-oxoprolinase subunit PxpA [Opitutaceae bacterium]
MTIDLNCDLGEGAGRDAELMPLVTSANIACGAHAGDETTMRATVRLARRHGVAIGAHPGFADRANFGRLEQALSPVEARELVLGQVAAIRCSAAGEGAVVTHVKLHGAFYNQTARDAGLAAAVHEAVIETGVPALMVPAASVQERISLERGGLRVVAEVFADRAYRADGSLAPRTLPGAVIDDEAVAVAQVGRLVRDGRVRAITGEEIILRGETVCLHGDGVRAVAFAGRLREALAARGVEVRAFAS